MALPAGTRLGRYEVLSPLGAGGMCEVYRARDTSLQRDVAIQAHLLADGQSLVYYDTDDSLRFLDMKTGRSEQLLRVGWSSLTNNRQFRVTRDNRQIVFLRFENEADIWLMSRE
jgi:serine/threonine protein kinase